VSSSRIRAAIGEGDADEERLNRHRHLLNDIASLLPHSRKDAKLDTKSKLYQLNELAELYNCNNVFFFEARKGKDLYLWMSKAPNGPTVKMHMQNRTSPSLSPPQSKLKRINSTYNGRTPLHRQLP
jgi:ribosome biogenesis protein BRX1